MSNVKTTTIAKLSQNLLTIKASTSLTQTLSKIKNAKRSADIILVEKPKASQMAAVIWARLSGKKFLWVQNFQNPPVPSFITRLLISQADKIIVSSKKDFNKLKKFGVDKEKIRYLK